MIKELDTVVLTEDLPEHGLKRADLGTVVQYDVKYRMGRDAQAERA